MFKTALHLISLFGNDNCRYFFYVGNDYNGTLFGAVFESENTEVRHLEPTNTNLEK